LFRHHCSRAIRLHFWYNYPYELLLCLTLRLLLLDVQSTPSYGQRRLCQYYRLILLSSLRNFIPRHFNTYQHAMQLRKRASKAFFYSARHWQQHREEKNRLISVRSLAYPLIFVKTRFFFLFVGRSMRASANVFPHFAQLPLRSVNVAPFVVTTTTIHY
jgi:hypothetical protein